MHDPELGVVVTSRAGRDKGRAFVIIGREGSEYVLLVDGQTRRMERPKRKKLRHVHVEACVAEGIRSRLLESAPVLDADVRKALGAFGYNTDSGK